MKNKQPGEKAIPQQLLQPYEKSPIYRTAEGLLAQLHSAQSRMDKRHKYTTGQKLCEKSLEVAESVAWAYMETDKLSIKIGMLKNTVRKVTTLLILIRMANRLNLINGPLHIELVSGCVSIIKQATGWINKVSSSAEDGKGPEREPQQNNSAASECLHHGRTTQEVKDNTTSATACGNVGSSM